MPRRILKRILIHPLLWRIVGFVSSIVALTCFALSPSFYDLFGRWNLFKSAIYSIISLSVITMMLFVEKCTSFTRSVMVKAHVGFLVMMLTSLCSIWQDLNSQKENDENGSGGRILNMFWSGAFGLMSLSLSRQLELGFEVGIFSFFFGSFLVSLIKMNFKLAPLAAILARYRETESGMNHQRETRGRVDSSDTLLLDDIESGNHSVDLQRMDDAEHFMHKDRLQEHAQRFHMPLPIYQAVEFGLAHAPQCRSAVSVGGKSYTSKNVFPNRVDSDQDVAKLALKHLTTGVKDEGLSMILEGSTSFKSILNDYAQKMKLKYKYNPLPNEGLAGFKSSLNLNGKHYTGDPRKTKNEAEQSAACAAVLSNLESFLF
ncbi:hypothetical protein K1719_017156 [Acacia pycnantha]|nr:hypothetical protein K1719_017156 [Acacia pycnantha]